MKMPMLMLVAWAALLMPATRAEDALMKGGKSPDGKYEVRIAPDKELNYSLSIRGTDRAAKAHPLPEIGGWMSYNAAQEHDLALWHASSRLVAISDSGGKRSNQVHLWALVEGKFVPLPLPGFEDNALGRVGALYSDRANMVTPVKWDGDKLHLKYVFTANNLTFYTFLIILEAKFEPQVLMPRVTMQKIEQAPEEKEPAGGEKPVTGQQ